MASSLYSIMSRLSIAARWMFLTGLVALGYRFVKRRSFISSRTSVLASRENILVVGASSGVGRAIALEYAKTAGRQKVRIHLVARKSCDVLVQQLQYLGVDATSSEADVTQPEDVLRLADELSRKFDKLDTVIICAGALTIQPILALTKQTQSSSPRQLSNPKVSPTIKSLSILSDIARQSYSANVLPSLLLTSALLPLLLVSEAPRICVLSSVAAEIPAPTRALYGAHKAALSMLLRSLRIELEDLILAESGAKKSIGITIINPASIETGLRALALDSDKPEDIATNQIPERKAMSPEYVARQALQAIDQQLDEVWLPATYWWISKIGQLVLPNAVKKGAKKKYNFS